MGTVPDEPYSVWFGPNAANKMRWVKMSSRTADKSQRQAALLAGLGYAAIIVLALFANFVVLERLTEPDNAAATVGNIANSAGLFRTAVAAFVVVFVADAVVAWALYLLFRRTSRQLSLFAAWFRLVYVAIAAAALLNLLTAARLVDGAGYAADLAEGQRAAQAMLSLDAYHYGWRIGLVFFGVHLLLLGLVMVKSDYAPSILGRLVALAGLAYVAGNLALILLPDNDNYADLFLLLSVVLVIPGEFGLTGWLLWKGAKGPTAGKGEDEMTAEGRPLASRQG
jgi:hypothetical protein